VSESMKSQPRKPKYLDREIMVNQGLGNKGATHIYFFI
jgi:hypothetical protein